MESKSKKFPVGLVLTTKEYLTRLGKASLIFCASNDFMVGVNIVALEFIMTWRQPAPQIKGHRIETQVQMSDSGQVLSSHVMLGVSK